MIHHRLPNNVRVGARATVSVLESGPDVDAQVRRKLREDVAEFIRNEHVKVETTGQLTEYSIDLYVLTPDQLYRLINEEAHYLASRYFPRMFLEEPCKKTS